SWLFSEWCVFFFCFPCLLFQSPGTETIWTATGVRDLKHFNDKCKKHKSCRSHLTNSLKLSLFGRLSIAEQLDEGYQIGIRKHVVSSSVSESILLSTSTIIH